MGFGYLLLWYLIVLLLFCCIECFDVFFGCGIVGLGDYLVMLFVVFDW